MRSKLVLLVLSASLLLTVPVTPAGASVPGRGPVTNDAYVAGHALKGLSEDEVRAIIAASVKPPSLPSCAVRSGDATLTFDSRSALTVNVDRMLSEAYAATADSKPYVLTPQFSVKTAVVSSWANTMAKKFNRSARNASFVVHKETLVVVKPVNGRVVLKGGAGRLLARAVRSTLATRAKQVVTTPFAVKVPAVTLSNLGKAILINRSRFSVKLYRGAKIEKTYRCAVGRAQYPTPTGKFKVTGKVKNPSWHNPGSAWAANMPSYIGPGPNNPLGLAAIYLSAPGIRIHGVPASELGSIGSPASHGCIRMSNHDALDLYPRVAVGIPVFIIR